MRGQGGNFNAFPGTYYLEYGSNGINHQLGQNNLVPHYASFHDGYFVMGWMGESSSVGNTQTPIWFQGSLAEDGSLPSLGAGAGTDQRLEERHAEPNITPLELYASMSPGNGELTNAQSVSQGASSSAIPQIIDLNATHEGRGIDSNLDTGAGLCLTSKPAGSDADQNAPASDHYNSNTLMISSGIAGYVLEESEGREDPTSNGRHLSCQRAPEDASGMSLGESSRSAKQAGHSQQQAVASQENAHTSLNIISPMNNHLNLSYLEQLGAGGAGLVVGLPAVPFWHQPSSTLGSGLGTGAGGNSEMHLTSSAVVQEEHFPRNISLRRSANQLVNLSTWTTRNPHVQSPGQPPVLFPFDRLPNTSSVAGVVNSAPPMQPLIQVPNCFQTQQPFQWNGVTRSITSVPSSYPYTVNGGDTLHRAENSRSNHRHGMLLPEIQRGNFSYLPTNLNFASGTSFPGNIAYSSGNGSSSNIQQPSVPTWFPQGNMAEQYAQSMVNMVNHTESQDQGSYWPIYSVASAARERELPARTGNASHFQMPLRSGLAMRAERPIFGHPDIAVRPLTVAQRRSRLVSEVHNALALGHEGGSLRFEDVMVIDRSVLYGVPEEPDLHQDMRLDVDNMSYEELLGLEEQIGNVCIGLSKDDIMAHLKQQKYQSSIAGSPIEEDPCCICQEEYADGEDLGKLNCGHDFHFNCIKQWLGQKNSCPICKNTGLDV